MPGAACRSGCGWTWTRRPWARSARWTALTGWPTSAAGTLTVRATAGRSAGDDPAGSGLGRGARRAASCQSRPRPPGRQRRIGQQAATVRGAVGPAPVSLPGAAPGSLGRHPVCPPRPAGTGLPPRGASGTRPSGSGSPGRRMSRGRTGRRVPSGLRRAAEPGRGQPSSRICAARPRPRPPNQAAQPDPWPSRPRSARPVPVPPGWLRHHGGQPGNGWSRWARATCSGSPWNGGCPVRHS